MQFHRPAFEEPVTQENYQAAVDAWQERHTLWMKSDATKYFNPFPVPKDETFRQMELRMVMAEIVHRAILSKLYPEDDWLFGRIPPWELERLNPLQRALLQQIQASREREMKYPDVALEIALESRARGEQHIFKGLKDKRDAERWNDEQDRLHPERREIWERARQWERSRRQRNDRDR